MPDINYLQLSLARGHKFESMSNSEGWDLVISYYKNLQADLTQRIFASSVPIVQFQSEVDEVRGVKKLLDSINYDLQVLNDQRQQPFEPVAIGGSEGTADLTIE